MPPTVPEPGDQEFVKDVVVLTSVSVGVVFLICISLVGSVIVRRLRKDDLGKQRYQKIPQFPELLPSAMNNEELITRYANMFQIRGDELTLGARIGKGRFGRFVQLF